MGGLVQAGTALLWSEFGAQPAAVHLRQRTSLATALLSIAMRKPAALPLRQSMPQRTRWGRLCAPLTRTWRRVCAFGLAWRWDDSSGDSAAELGVVGCPSLWLQLLFHPLLEPSLHLPTRPAQGREWLAGEALSLADIVVACDLYHGFTKARAAAMIGAALCCALLALSA